MNSGTVYLSKVGLNSLVEDIRSKGGRFIAPARPKGGMDRDEVTDYREVQGAGEVVYEGPLPRRSLKEFFLPPTESLFCYRRSGSEIIVEPVNVNQPLTLVFGAYPCDVAALPVVDAVMDWDYRDEPWFARRRSAVIITRVCEKGDSSCFCSSVGLSADSNKGSDIVMFSEDGPEGGYFLRALSEKGEEFISAHGKHFEKDKDHVAAEERAKRNASAAVAGEALDLVGIKNWLEKNFEDSIWDALPRICHGCGACAVVCPTCHCFDIVDEPEGIEAGTRRRNWDTCQAGMFTLHGSGHNPRDTQKGRFRQRIMHKFQIYPERFGHLLCTGCGRCVRACPGGMDLPGILSTIQKRATKGSRVE